MKNLLKQPFLQSLLLVSTLWISDAASALPEVTCHGFLHQPGKDYVYRSPLKQASYDPMWYEADILHYGLGADYSYLPEQGVGLIIYDNKTNRSTSVTSGFRRIGKSKHYEADLKLYDHLPSGEQVIVGIQCGYTEL